METERNGQNTKERKLKKNIYGTGRPIANRYITQDRVTGSADPQAAVATDFPMQPTDHRFCSWKWKIRIRHRRCEMKNLVDVSYNTRWRRIVHNEEEGGGGRGGNKKKEPDG